MPTDEIHVTKNGEGRWRVSGRRGAEVHTFHLRAHAIAWAYALARSTRAAIWVHEKGGAPVRQSSGSAIYSAYLD